jgi:thiol-disulfide isomerase/thioredoxin
LPVWLDGKTKLQLNLDADGCLTNKSDANNRALSAFNEDFYRRSRTLWETSQQATPDEVKALAGGYLTVADSLITVLRPNAAVTSYLRAWAYTSAAGFWITRYPKDPLPWTDGQTVLDNAVAATLYDTPRIILHTLPHDSLGARLAYLYDHYQTEALRRRVGTTLVQQFIRQYDYAKDYVSGLRQVREAVEKYQLPESLVNDFTARLSTVSGQPFPEVVLKDSLGQTFDFASLKGRYVYIDLWASWCVPCIKEIPSLRKLEAACKDLPVAFVSISIDQSREAWLKRKRSLGLTGLQLHDSNGRLAEALNVKGIPHFLVYDKQGRLLVYDAPRPSSTEALTLLKGLK